jgi:hypothetical protein
MGKTRAAYPSEFRRQMVELVRAGRSPEELAREFEPTAQSIRQPIRAAGALARVESRCVRSGCRPNISVAAPQMGVIRSRGFVRLRSR